MGYGKNGSNLPDQYRIEKKFAWMPVVSSSKKRVWLTYYYIRRTYHDDNGKPPIYRLNWDYIFTKNEYLLELLK
jgi:hypothetical protein